MADLAALESWATPLLAQLSQREVRRLAVTIARELRRSQAQRIAAQRNPDGSAYEPRKPQRLRDRQGEIRRGAMFSRLRLARHLRAGADGEGAFVGFTARTARIAEVHQHGLRDRVQPGGPEVRYPARVLLGFTDVDRARIEELLLQHLVR